MTNLNFVFIGGTYRGYRLLESLIEKKFIPKYVVILKEDNHEVDKYSTQMIEIARINNLTYSFKKKLDVSDLGVIKSRIWDFAFICGWRTIIPFDINRFFTHGLIAAHDSLLPKYRGFAPLNWAIINGEEETGVTLFKIDEGEVDSGKVYRQQVFKIAKTDYAIDVFYKSTEATIKLFLLFLNDFQNSNLSFYTQDEKKATYTCKRSPSDGKIDWNKSSFEIYNLIRALADPYPGAFCEFNGEIYIIQKAIIGENNVKVFSGRIAGKVYSIKNDYIEVLCGEGSINIFLWKKNESVVIEQPSKIVKSITTVLK
jgi:methionyl-tRNA formyltransferase